MIPAGFLQDLLSRVDIVDVVGRHVELKRGGANLMGLCPFHAEKSPSFSVSPAKQFYYCFGCGASGDAIRFLTEHLGLSFVEAVRELAQGVGMEVPEEQVSDQERQRRDTLRQRRAGITQVLERAAAFYRAQLKAAPRAVDYLKRRGLTGEIAARFGLGYAPPGWRTLAGVFPAYDDPVLEEAGLVRQKSADDDAAPADVERGRYDWFRDRIMFPIRGVSGEVIGFGGRVLDDGKPKYINSPETPVFSKGRELYGLYEARQALRDKGAALVVEGYMDVVALAQLGFPNAVATLGTACTEDHVRKLFRFTDTVVFSFDGDAAGRRAAARALEAALPHAGDLRQVRFLFLPPEHDPDSYVREFGAEAFERQIAAAVPLSRQLVEQAAEGCDPNTVEGRARFLAHAKPLWSALPDGALKRQLLPELARRATMEAADLASLWGGSTPAAAQRAAPSSHDTTSAADAPYAPDTPYTSPPTRARPAARRPTRRAPAGPADLALRLLLRHSDWWESLSADDHHLLHGLGGAHGEAVAWLERQLVEHGPQPWSALAEALAAEDDTAALRDDVMRWMAGAAPDEEHEVADLRRVLARLMLQQLEDESALLAAAAATDDAARTRLRAVLDRMRELKAALAGGSGSG
ncbi:MAG: DNA primase [Rubrivivax sp.]|nr:DNA primase [Rubrivivax sp.]